MKAVIAMLWAVLASALLCACAESDRYAEWKPGESVRANMEAQRLNPDAGGDKPVTGMDGVAAMQAVKRYEKRGEEKKSQGVLENMVDLYGGAKQDSK
ncbi:hypothetical protein [Fundidesulfovibrio soli]|uniref:hypothetical protein n=1 Tax=Fundidesulfovibrio soli TaxID=2922716 RepID=UPI001FAFF01A|nr:hypothetical protein [Fundidesulfovibrio soli]